MDHQYPSYLDIATWRVHNFPTASGPDCALVLAEEVGEVCRCVVKMRQGIRGSEEDWLTQLSKELGDAFIALTNVATMYGIELDVAARARWEHIQLRDWNLDRKGHGIHGR